MKNLAEELLSITGKTHIEQLANTAISNSKVLKQLIQLYTQNDEIENKVCQRAAWVLSNVADKNIQLLKPYTKIFVEQLCKENVHNAITRNAARILQNMPIAQEYHGDVMNACFNLIEKPTTAPAIKAFSLTTLFNLTKLYPEIKNELRIIIEELWDNETAAFKSRGKKILNHLKKIPKT